MPGSNLNCAGIERHQDSGLAQAAGNGLHCFAPYMNLHFLQRFVMVIDSASMAETLPEGFPVVRIALAPPLPIRHLSIASSGQPGGLVRRGRKP